MRRIRILTILAAAGCAAGALAVGSSASHAMSTETPATATGALVSVASPAGPFQRNMHGLPTVAVDPAEPGILATSANDLEDMQPCSEKASVTAGTCSLPADPVNGGSFNNGVGMSGVYFSFDSGHRWIQPTYHGLTAAGCDPTAEPCTAKPGPIHTVPNYAENGLRTRGDAYVAFGPVLRDGRFSWANGSRLYLSTLVNNLTGTAIQPGRIDSKTTVTVSHIDNPTPARVADQSNWSNPVIVPKTEPAISLPTENRVWADNASSSRFFGNVYVCYNDFDFLPNGNVPVAPTVAVSSDGGQTWTTHQIAPATDSASQGYRMGCEIRTDSHGTVYAFMTHFSGVFPSNGMTAEQTVVKSFDGGTTWTQPVDFMQVNTACYYFDPVGFRCAEEGPGGSPDEPQISVDIANGAPTGAGATNEIAFVWGEDGRFGQNNEATLLWYSTDSAKTWSAPVKVSLPGERAQYASVAIAPDGSRVYVTYTAFTTPFTMTTSTPRLIRGDLRSAAIGPDGAPAGWTTNYIGRSGDARGTGLGDYNYEELVGYYVSATATRSYGAGVWTDMSRAADCPAIDAWRQASLNANNVVTPAPWPLSDCPATFGNADLVSATTARAR